MSKTTVIEVNNEQEFNILMHFYEHEKEWKWQDGTLPTDASANRRYPTYLNFSNGFGYSNSTNHLDRVVSFDSFDALTDASKKYPRTLTTKSGLEVIAYPESKRVSLNDKLYIDFEDIHEIGNIINSL